MHRCRSYVDKESPYLRNAPSSEPISVRTSVRNAQRGGLRDVGVGHVPHPLASVRKGSFPLPVARPISPLAPLSLFPSLLRGFVHSVRRRQVMETNENVDTIKGLPPALHPPARPLPDTAAAAFDRVKKKVNLH